MPMMEEPPLRKVSHEERVDVGKKICSKALETFHDNVLAVLIIGSTSKSLDRPFSDLEMDVIVRGWA